MRGPAPKDPALRQRRNKAPSVAVLPAHVDVPVPAMPVRAKGDEWHPLAVEFWQRMWTSPMAVKYLDADRNGQLVLLELVDQFWKKPNHLVAKEIRQHAIGYGLNPLDRNRLQWKVEEEGPKKAEPQKVRRDFDPGKVLEMPRKKS